MGKQPYGISFFRRNRNKNRTV